MRVHSTTSSVRPQTARRGSRTAAGLLATAVVAVSLAVGVASASPAAACVPQWAPIPADGSPPARVARLYAAYFGRSPDPAGHATWTNLLARRRMSLTRIANAFAASAEFQQRYGALSNRDFVRLVYNNVLGREPDPGGWAGWTRALDTRRMTRGAVMAGFSESLEFRTGRAAFPPCVAPAPAPSVAPAPAPASHPAPAPSGWQAEMLAAVNAHRAAAGLAPLQLCGTLNNAAAAHSADMAAHGFVGHTGSNGSTMVDRVNAAGYEGWTRLGENAAGGFVTVADVVRAWMASSGHRANILNPAFTHLGVGDAYSPHGVRYWTQVFGAGGCC